MKVEEAREALIPLANMAAPQGNPQTIMEAADAYALAAHVEACTAGYVRTSSDPHDGQPRCGKDGHYCETAPKGAQS